MTVSAGWACVVAFRHPQVFSFPSAGIVGSPALGCCAPPAGDTTVRPIHSVCRFPPPATAKCHGLRCSFACGLALPLGPFVIPVSGHYRLIVFCRHPPFTQRARCARDTSQIPAIAMRLEIASFWLSGAVDAQRLTLVHRAIPCMSLYAAGGAFWRARWRRPHRDDSAGRIFQPGVMPRQDRSFR